MPPAKPGRSLGAVAIIACLALTGCVGPQAADAAGGAAGDAALLKLIRPSFIDDSDRVAVAVIEGGEVRTAFLRADASTVFEIGSITKVFTGELLAEAIERGEVRATDQLGEYLDLRGAPAGFATLRDAAAHRAGLPTFPTDPDWIERATADMEAGRDGVDETLDELLAEARAVEVDPDQGYAYSNMGVALLGQALAAAAGTDYGTLLTERLLEPLQLEHASLPLLDDEVPETHAGGFDPDGEPVEPSSLAAYAPAGGIDATIGDLAAFASAVIDGPLADSAALTDTIALDDESALGYLWSVRDDDGHLIVSHNGMTGGFASMMLIDRTAGTAAIVLSNQAEVVDDVAQTLLDHLG